MERSVLQLDTDVTYNVYLFFVIFPEFGDNNIQIYTIYIYKIHPVVLSSRTWTGRLFKTREKKTNNKMYNIRYIILF